MTKEKHKDTAPLFDGREDQHTEFKEQWSDTALKTVAAFMNTDGGVIYIGICDDRTICGIAEEKLDKTANHIGNILDAHFPNDLYTIAYQTFENRVCIKITIKKTNRLPVKYEGKYYKRDFVRTCIMETEELFERFAVSNEPQIALSASTSPFHAFLCDLSDASRLAFAYAMASSEKQIDFHQGDGRRMSEYAITHRLPYRKLYAFFRLPDQEWQELLKNIKEAERQGFVVKNQDGGYIIQASCERKSLQRFIDDELQTEFMKFPPLAWTILTAVCAEPNRTIGIDNEDIVHLLRGYRFRDELAAPSFEEAPCEDLKNAAFFLISRESLYHQAQFHTFHFYPPTSQGIFLNTLRQNRFKRGDAVINQTFGK